MIMAELRLSVTFHTRPETRPARARIMQNPFMLLTFLPILQIRLARKRIMASFAISAGCTETPRSSHLLAPFASYPKGVITSRIKRMDTT